MAMLHSPAEPLLGEEIQPQAPADATASDAAVRTWSLNAYNSLPEAIARPGENEKEVAVGRGKEMAVPRSKETVQALDLPQALDDEGHKETVRRAAWSAPEEKELASHTRPGGRLSWLRRKRVLAVLGLLVVLVVLAIGLGAGLGVGSAGARSQPTAVSSPASTSGTSYEASVIPTPGVSPATGTYRLALSSPQETQGACLTDQAQQAAWNCDLGASAQPGVVVAGLPNAAGDSLGASIFFAPSTAKSLTYGSQTAGLQTSISSFVTVTDNEDPSAGPAYFFQTYWDKLVVVPEDALSTSGSGKRALPRRGALQSRQQESLQPGDQPWFCFWNDTYVEGYIYVVAGPDTQVASVTSDLAASSSTQSSAASLASMTSTMASSSTPTSSVSGASQTIDAAQYASLQVYPNTVKIEERRVAGSGVAPYCQQRQVLDDGSAAYIVDGNGDPVVLQLDEEDPDYLPYAGAVVSGAGRQKARRAAAGGCHCQWISGQ